MTEPNTGAVTADPFLVGAIDIHHHGYPEISFDQRMPLDDAAELRHARAAGMAGIVFKSHMWPTCAKVHLLADVVPGINAYSSLTMNPVAGGFSPIAVESAARQGASFLFFPTWGALHDRHRGGFSHHLGHMLERASGLDTSGALDVLDEAGRVRPEVRECLAVAGEFRMAIGTGHISPAESLAVAEAAKDYGIEEIFFQHPDSNSVAASRDEILEMARRGAVIELCALGLLPPLQRIKPAWMVEIIEAVGADQCVLTTDTFFEWAPPAAETLRMTARILVSMGVPQDTIRVLVRDVPRRLLHLDA
jgi:hypothetical protein